MNKPPKNLMKLAKVSLIKCNSEEEETWILNFPGWHLSNCIPSVILSNPLLSIYNYLPFNQVFYHQGIADHDVWPSQRAQPSSAAPGVVFPSSLAFLVDVFPSLFAPVREPEVSTEVFFWRCLLSVTQPGKLWDGIKGIFVVESQGGDWNSSYKLTSLRPPDKKKIGWSLWISRWINISMLSLANMKQKQQKNTGFTTKSHGPQRLFFEQLFRVFFSFFQQFLTGHQCEIPMADMNSGILNSWLPWNHPYIWMFPKIGGKPPKMDGL